MLKGKIILLPALLLTTMTMGCEDELPFPKEPEIEFLSISPDKQLTGSADFLITIHYQDGDGDLGADPGAPEPAPTIFVRDNRPDVPDSVNTSSFTIPNLTPDARKPSIQGTMEINVVAPPPCFLWNPSCEDSLVTFDVWIEDRAGNVSNTVTTTPVIITY